MSDKTEVSQILVFPGAGEKPKTRALLEGEITDEVIDDILSGLEEMQSPSTPKVENPSQVALRPPKTGVTEIIDDIEMKLKMLETNLEKMDYFISEVETYNELKKKD